MKKASVIIDDLIRREAGFVDHPADRGGPTNFGITQATLSRWRGREATEEDVRTLTENEARQIYQSDFVEPFIGVVQEPLLGFLVDSGVQHGVGDAIRWLQDAAGVKTDGKIGPVTRRAIDNALSIRLYWRVFASRMRYYGQLTSNDDELVRAREAGFDLQAEFTEGWLNRLSEFVEARQ
ncbi:MAG TPA: glycosyl hydrolase 108 family protein [Gammaproteobacteria bacterium]|nr:glycosyl hydrolase 108 family protein [Gammaproteobacteria bacterium]